MKKTISDVLPFTYSVSIRDAMQWDLYAQSLSEAIVDSAWHKLYEVIDDPVLYREIDEAGGDSVLTEIDIEDRKIVVEIYLDKGDDHD